MSISEKEFLRRYKAIKGIMAENGLDCLLITGRADYFSRGNVRYITNLGTGGYVIFPLDGSPIFLTSPAQAASPKLRKIGPVLDLLQLSQVSEDPLGDIKRDLLRFDRGNHIGIVGMTEISVPTYLAMQQLFRDRLVDATWIFAQLRPVKSAEEIERIRTAASIADEVCTMLMEMIRPGLSDYEIYGAVKKKIYEMRSEYSMELIDADGAKMNMWWNPSGDKLEAQGTLFLEITPSCEGYYAQLPVSLPVGKYSPRVREMVAVLERAIEAGVALLRPGTRVADVYSALVKTVQEQSFLSPLRPGHAIGLDVIDFWSITESNETILLPGMTLTIHPSVFTELGGDGVGMGYTYLITETGAEKLSKIDLCKLG
jgi:Xaa-Pro dipeptidase